MAVPPFGEATGLDTSDAQSKGWTAACDGGASQTAAPTGRSRRATDEDGEPYDPSELPEENDEGDGGAARRSDIPEARLLQLARISMSQAKTYHQTMVRPSWERNYKAYRNEHFAGSKYASDEWKGRSKLFRPKTRSAVRKLLISTANAMFSTGDVVSIEPENTSDDFQGASAAIKQELINYRLSRVSKRNGIPWFFVSMGARLDSILTSICCTKQTWKYKEKQVVTKLVLPDGRTVTQLETKKIMDRPDILSVAPENVLYDPNAEWTNPAQNSRYLHVRFPMTIEDVLDMIQTGDGSMIPWKEISEQQIRGYLTSGGPSDTMGARVSREGGKDPKQQTSGEFGTVWVTEHFMRHDGIDWCYWSIGEAALLISDPVPTDEAYPALDGERPYVIGYGAFETHRASPMSLAESWQPLQQEANDTCNLRLDHMKQALTPPVKVKRGKKVDAAAVARRGQNTVLYLQDLDDVDIMQNPDVPQSAYVETNYLNADFDDLAGSFNGSSVQTNKALNETVGGMRLLSGDANSAAEFDLNIWVESWVERVIWQILKLEEHYETDETVIAIAGEKAKLFEKFGVNEITDEMLQAESTVTVKIGVGSSNEPMQKMQKFMMAAGALQQILAPFVQMKSIQVVPNGEEIAQEIFGAAGFQDGGTRFFTINPAPPPQQPPPDPKLIAEQGKQQIAQQKIALDGVKLKADSLLRAQEMQNKQTETAAKLQDASAKRASDIYQTHMKTLAEIERARLDAHVQATHQGREHAFAASHGVRSALDELFRRQVAPDPEPEAAGQVNGG